MAREKMKLDRLETHDRFQHFIKQNYDISACCQNLIDQKPFGNHPFYIFAHARTDDDGFTKRLIWQPRLTKPKAQVNSMLFKVYPGTDNLKIIWIIPDSILWAQYRTGNITENSLVEKSIHTFIHHREDLDKKEVDDYEDWKINSIYSEMSKNKSNLVI